MPSSANQPWIQGFDYFVVRTRRGVAERLVGLAERLGTGEKRGFESGEQLLRLLERWSGAPENMTPVEQPGNAAGLSPDGPPDPSSVKRATPSNLQEDR